MTRELKYTKERLDTLNIQQMWELCIQEWVEFSVESASEKNRRQVYEIYLLSLPDKPND